LHFIELRDGESGSSLDPPTFATLGWAQRWWVINLNFVHLLKGENLSLNLVDLSLMGEGVPCKTKWLPTLNKVIEWTSGDLW